MQRDRSIAWHAAAVWLLLGFSGQAGAASLQVAPTSVALHPDQKAEAVWLSNTGTSEPVRAQVRLYRWTQEDGADRLEPTTAMVVSPPMIELAPDSRQLVRVVLAGPRPQGAEESYRIVVDEVPGEPTGDRPGLQFLLRYSIPVFVLPEGGDVIAHQLATRLERNGEKTTLVVDNAGRQHAQLADLAYVDGAGARHELLRGLVGYVLPGRTMRWELPAPSSLFADGGSFKARINGEAVEQTFAPARPSR